MSDESTTTTTESGSTPDSAADTAETASGAVDAPTKTSSGRGRRRAASRPAGPPTFSAPEAPGAGTSTDDATPAPVRGARAAAVFQAPPPMPEAESGGSARDANAGSRPTDADSTADSGGDSGAPDGQTRTSTRRRRGGRGRGRGAADQAPDAADGQDAEAPADVPDGDSGDAGEKGDGGAKKGKGKGKGKKKGKSASQDEAGDAGGAEASDESADADESTGGEDGDGSGQSSSSRRRRRRRRGRGGGSAESGNGEAAVRVRGGRNDEVAGVKGSTRLEAKRQRRREGREAGRRRSPLLTEAEYLARRESVSRSMIVRQSGQLVQIAVLEDDVLVEHYVNSGQSRSMLGNIYLGKVQNVVPGMEAAFIDIGRGRNAVLYAGDVNWPASGLKGEDKRVEKAFKSGDTVLAQVIKDPVGSKGARLTQAISLPGRFLVYDPYGSMAGISRRLPDTERRRLKKVLKEAVPEDAGVIVRTAAEGASEEQLKRDVEALRLSWEQIQAAAESGSAPALLHSEDDLVTRVIRDQFNEDVSSMVIAGDDAWRTVSEYVEAVAPDLSERISKWTGTEDVFTANRVDEQLAKALNRKVHLPSGGSLVIDRTEAMTVIDVNTSRNVGSKDGNLEEILTRNNLEAAEEIVRQLRLRDIGGIIVIDFVDMVVPSNRDLVLRRLIECLSRDRTKHQVSELTSLGLVQMTRKRIGESLLDAFSTQCDHCAGRGVIVQTHPVMRGQEERHVPDVRKQKVTGAIPGAPRAAAENADADVPADLEADVAAAEAAADAAEELVAEQAADEAELDAALDAAAEAVAEGEAQEEAEEDRPESA